LLEFAWRHFDCKIPEYGTTKNLRQNSPKFVKVFRTGQKAKHFWKRPYVDNFSRKQADFPTLVWTIQPSTTATGR